jgi:hypothetical protein
MVNVWAPDETANRNTTAQRTRRIPQRPLDATRAKKCGVPRQWKRHFRRRSLTNDANDYLSSLGKRQILCWAHDLAVEKPRKRDFQMAGMGRPAADEIPAHCRGSDPLQLMRLFSSSLPGNLLETTATLCKRASPRIRHVPSPVQFGPMGSSIL